MRLTVIGSGDAFGTGGRFMPCFMLEAAGRRCLLECGATSTVALNRMGIDANTIEAVVISHLHGDHFSGLIFFVLQGRFGQPRRTPLTIYGPAGIEARYRAAFDVLYPGFLSTQIDFEVRFVEMVAGTTTAIGGCTVATVEVDHPYTGSTAHGLRFSHAGKTLAFTGDTRWCDAIVPLGRGADLYIMDCYAPETTAAAHLTWAEIRANLDRIGARRYLMVHMNSGMLAHRGDINDPRVTCADDGMVVDL